MEACPLTFPPLGSTFAGLRLDLPIFYLVSYVLSNLHVARVKIERYRFFESNGSVLSLPSPLVYLLLSYLFPSSSSLILCLSTPDSSSHLVLG